MKLALVPALGLAALLAACNSKPDSVEQAQDMNEKKIEAGTPDSTQAGKDLVDARTYDTDFMTKAAAGGLLEVQLGQQVAGKAASQQVRQLGARIVQDHRTIDNELTTLAQKLNVTLPTMLSDEGRSTFRDVTGEHGIAMDKAYLSKMEEDHKKDIAAYEEASTKAASPELKAFAAKTLPTLREHLAMVEKAKPAVDAMK